MRTSQIISAVAVVTAIVLGGAYLGGHFDEEADDTQAIISDPPATESQAAAVSTTAELPSEGTTADPN